MGAALAANGRHLEALEFFTEFIRVRPGFARAHLARGAVYSSIGSHKRALSDYDKAVDLSPGDARNYNGRGLAYYKLGDIRKAVLDYTRAIKHDPGMASAYNNRGNAYLDSGKIADAVADYNRALQANPGYAEAYNSRGTAYNTLNKPSMALADFTRALELNPEYPLSTAFLYCFARAASPPAMRAERASASPKASELSFSAFWNCAYTSGFRNMALMRFAVFSALNATYAEAYSNRGVAFQQQGKLKKAHEDYTNAIFSDPDYAGAYLNRAMLNMNMKKTRQACADAERACKLGDCRVKIQFQDAGSCN